MTTMHKWKKKRKVRRRLVRSRIVIGNAFDELWILHHVALSPLPKTTHHSLQKNSIFPVIFLKATLSSLCQLLHHGCTFQELILNSFSVLKQPEKHILYQNQQQAVKWIPNQSIKTMTLKFIFLLLLLIYWRQWNRGDQWWLWRAWRWWWRLRWRRISEAMVAVTEGFSRGGGEKVSERLATSLLFSEKQSIGRDTERKR